MRLLVVAFLCLFGSVALAQNADDPRAWALQMTDLIGKDSIKAIQQLKENTTLGEFVEGSKLEVMREQVNLIARQSGMYLGTDFVKEVQWGPRTRRILVVMNRQRNPTLMWLTMYQPPDRGWFLVGIGFASDAKEFPLELSDPVP